MRVAVGLEYDGSGFHGWQTQVGVATVQARVEQALSRVADRPVTLVAAGRTDRGVHATCQVAHFDTEVVREMRAWVFGGNVHLPPGVALLWARPVVEEFHARFRALSRRYRYLILNRPVRPGLGSTRLSWYYHPLDAECMARAGQSLVGEHDFSSYRAVGCQAKSPVRTIHSLEVSRRGQCVVIDVHANAFLHHMVRNIAGVLMAIGGGERPEQWAKEVLDYRDRTLGGVTAPPQGLYLVGVTYPAQYGLPAFPDACGAEL